MSRVEPAGEHKSFVTRFYRTLDVAFVERGLRTVREPNGETDRVFRDPEFSDGLAE